MKKGYIIATASGWYWRAYDIKRDEFNGWYTIFNDVKEAEKYLEKALECRNVGTPAIEIKQVYYKT